MKVNILNFVLFSIIICSFEYAKKELYFINERKIYLERNIINFKNNRILADADKQFNLNNFYESTLSLANKFNDYNDDDEDIIYLRNIIDSHAKKYKESNTTPNLNNLDGKTKKLIHKIQKELNEAKKELDNERNGELSIHLIQDKRVIKKSENIFDIDNNKIHNEYNKITLSNCYKKLKKISKSKKSKKNIIIKVMLLIATLFVIVALGIMDQMLLLVIFVGFIFFIIGEDDRLYELQRKLKSNLYILD
ncbi:fam-b protein [Plasmodium vinckei vinckei]|uniref:Fam-b protein n=1 Tax=Plasmodium vinckei vinckei TaxID=54757 RepID=A0A449BNB9_PLAVN|nr:fam-b protein [Plasmodium vinckei vinckei]VEV54902.1 fam-b protein [Plasmodium vinckei vinckei]